MTDAKLRDLVNDLLDNELSANDAQKLEQHASESPPAQLYIRRMQALDGYLSSMDIDINVPKRPNKWLFTARRSALGLAAMIALMVLPTSVAVQLTPLDSWYEPDTSVATISHSATSVQLTGQSAEKLMMINRETGVAGVHWVELYEVVTPTPQPSSLNKSQRQLQLASRG